MKISLYLICYHLINSDIFLRLYRSVLIILSIAIICWYDLVVDAYKYKGRRFCWSSLTMAHKEIILVAVLLVAFVAAGPIQPVENKLKHPDVGLRVVSNQSY